MPFDQIGAAAPQWFTDTELGPNQGLTPEGFLICRNVPLARLGVQRYHTTELPQVAANANGFIDVDRPAAEVFNPVSLASFEGKPVTLNHPATDVGLWNHRALAVGHVQNVRRGEGVQSDLVLGDLLITDPGAIDAIRNGLRGVSVGYDANYNQLGPGRARQCDIRANHIALVSEPRCGPRCSIGDSKMRKTMTWDEFITRDYGLSLGSGPELKGSRPGRVGASEAWNEDPPIVELPGPASDYRVVDSPSGRGCGVFRVATGARTGDRFAWGRSPMVKQRDAAQHSILRGINEANAVAWSKPEAQGKW
jgi:hypothetical protein